MKVSGNLRLGNNQMNSRTQSMPNTGYAVPSDRAFFKTLRPSSSSSKSKSTKRSFLPTDITLPKSLLLLANDQMFS